MNRKNIILILLLVAVTFTAGITHSYFIDKKEKINTINSGSSEILIQENFNNPSGDLISGTTYKKEVKVKNLSSESWIRMRIEVNNSETEKNIKINFNDNGLWQKKDDGYYYYINPVHKNETTLPVFSSVTALDNIPSGQLKIICYAESIQAEGHKTGSEPYLAAFATLQEGCYEN